MLSCCALLWFDISPEGRGWFGGHACLVARNRSCDAHESVCAGASAAPIGDGVKLDPARVTEELIVLNNRIRAEAKLHSLEPNKKLQAAAEEHVRDMAAHHKMTHDGSDGSTPSSRIIAAGYRMRRCGENVAFGIKTCEAVMKGWMNSPTHKVNILGNFTQIGAAYATATDGTPFWCVTFGSPRRRN